MDDRARVGVQARELGVRAEAREAPVDRVEPPAGRADRVAADALGEQSHLGAHAGEGEVVHHEDLVVGGAGAAGASGAGAAGAAGAGAAAAGAGTGALAAVPPPEPAGAAAGAPWVTTTRRTMRRTSTRLAAGRAAACGPSPMAGSVPDATCHASSTSTTTNATAEPPRARAAGRCDGAGRRAAPPVPSVPAAPYGGS